MNKKLSVSLMCADLMNMQRDVQILDKYHVNWFHLDVMDGHVVPNLTFGPDFVNELRGISKTTFDIHLMLENPEIFINAVNLTSKDYVTIHSELKPEIIKKSITLIKEKGAHVGLAFNPETPIEKAASYLNEVDLVLLMLVRPGFSGGKMIEGVMDKISITKKYLIEKKLNNVLISVDGNITLERANFMANAGADIFVGGTSAIFRKGMNLKDTIPAFYIAINS